jgi:Holliday junction resolvase RusA-like endonuclease
MLPLPCKTTLMRIKAVPLTANRLWKGRKFKTALYLEYEQELFYKLPKLVIDPNKKLKLDITFGFSNKLCDLSNPLKAFEDILQKKYGFNDRNVVEIHLRKDIVKKGEEYIDFNIKPYD